MSSCLAKVVHEVFNGIHVAEVLKNRITSIFLLYVKLRQRGPFSFAFASWDTAVLLGTAIFRSDFSYHCVWPYGKLLPFLLLPQHNRDQTP